VRLGPRAVASRRGQAELLDAAGFTSIGVTDVTEGLLGTARAWLVHTAELEGDLRRTIGDAVVDEQQAARTDMIMGVEEGLLSRALLVGVRPS
jgi:hypothetical protein